MTARLAADVDNLSGGRLILGLGNGWDGNEFANLGLPARAVIRSESTRTRDVTTNSWSTDAILRDKPADAGGLELAELLKALEGTAKKSIVLDAPAEARNRRARDAGYPCSGQSAVPRTVAAGAHVALLSTGTHATMRAYSAVRLLARGPPSVRRRPR
jgi:alkanesulfonate monooxygenase SsuD/methylene tetrahydromethanopterin reductase-like flavin-dependent oxidoreductase (luciferase family)